MDSQEKPAAADGESKSEVLEIDDWASFRDDDIMRQHYDIRDQEAEKIPYVGDKEPLSALTAEYQSGSPILLEKIKVLSDQYGFIRRTRGDGNCFFRGFMFAYLEYLLVSQDQTEVDRVKGNVEQCKKTLQSLGYAEFTFEDFFSLFLEQLDGVFQGSKNSISDTELVQRCRDQSVSDYVVMFFRFITSGEIKSRSEFFEPFILGLSDSTVDQFCKASVEPMGEESDHVHITALSDALGVPIRVVYLDRSSCDSGGISVNHHDFIPASVQHSPDVTIVLLEVVLIQEKMAAHLDSRLECTNNIFLLQDTNFTCQEGPYSSWHYGASFDRNGHIDESRDDLSILKDYFDRMPEEPLIEQGPAQTGLFQATKGPGRDPDGDQAQAPKRTRQGPDERSGREPSQAAREGRDCLRELSIELEEMRLVTLQTLGHSDEATRQAEAKGPSEGVRVSPSGIMKGLGYSTKSQQAQDQGPGEDVLDPTEEVRLKGLSNGPLMKDPSFMRSMNLGKSIYLRPYIYGDEGPGQPHLVQQMDLDWSMNQPSDTKAEQARLKGDTHSAKAL
ncbi:unnamed protein product [Rhodiola kirilowii]